MKKTITVQAFKSEIFKEQKLTIGLDLGDRWSFYCVLDEAGQVILEQKLATTREAMKQTFGKIPRSLIALETGTHSPWVSRLLAELGHEVIVAHAQKAQLITKSNRKDDRHDARTLARLARIDPALLGPVRHRSAKAQLHLTVIRARAELVSARTALVNAARGLVKSYGERLPRCGTYQVTRELSAALSTELQDVLDPLLKEIESLNERVKQYDERMEKIAKRSVPGSGLAQAGEGRGNTDRSDLCPDDRRPVSVCEESPGRLFSGVTTWPQELWRERTTERHQQRRRPVSAHDDGAGSALHSGAVRAGQRFAAMGIEALRARREKCQEASRRGRGSEAGGTAASVVGKGRGVRTTAQ